MLLDQKKLGSFLKLRRVSKGLSQNDVSHKLGYSSAQFVSNWERGVSAPPVDKLGDLIGLYGIPQKDFVKFMLGLHEKELKKALSKRAR
jgi:transcriptional regulator with XRE-family HTH domain